MMPGIALAGWAVTRPWRADPPGLQAVARIDARLAAPVATNRRIAVMSLDGGAGTSAVAAGIAAALARTRPSAVLAVDAHRSARGLAWHLGLDDPPPGRPVRPPVSAAHARELAAASPAGPLVVSAAAAVSDAASADDWWHVASASTRFFDVTVTDFGRRPTPDDVRRASARSHAVCLVARADRYSAERAAAAAASLGGTDGSSQGGPGGDGHRAGVPAVLCLVDRQGMRARVAPLLRARGVPAVTVPRERVLESARVGDPGLGLTTRIALDLLAGDLLTAARGLPGASRAAEVHA